MEVRLLPTRPLADRPTAGPRALNPPIVVRIHVCQPASYIVRLVGWWQRQHVRLLTGKIRVRIPALQPASCQRDAAAACPPFNRDEVGSTPTAGTNQASSNG